MHQQIERNKGTKLFEKQGMAEVGLTFSQGFIISISSKF
jgi:hypothetical protein